MLSAGIFNSLASATALRRRGLPSASPPPIRAAIVISLMTFVNIRPRLASMAPFLCLILCHLEWPDIAAPWCVQFRLQSSRHRGDGEGPREAQKAHNVLCLLCLLWLFLLRCGLLQSRIQRWSFVAIILHARQRIDRAAVHC